MAAAIALHRPDSGLTAAVHELGIEPVALDQAAIVVVGPPAADQAADQAADSPGAWPRPAQVPLSAVWVAWGTPNQIAEALRAGYDDAASDTAQLAVGLTRAEHRLVANTASARRSALSLAVRGTTHELNNIWAVVMGQADLIGMGLGPGHRVHENLQRVLAAGERGTALTRRLRLLVTLEPDSSLCCDPVAATAAAVRAANLTWTEPAASAEPAIPSVATTAERWQVLVGELVANALAATPAGAPAPEVALTAAADGVLLTIADHGPGLPAAPPSRANLDHWWLPYTSTKPVEPGYRPGLGLAIVEAIATSAGGQATATSRAGGGTQLSVWCPAAAAAAPTSQRPRSVLVVEPVEELREISELVLSAAGWSVATGESVSTGLSACSQSPSVAIVSEAIGAPAALEQIRTQHPDCRGLVVGNSDEIAGLAQPCDTTLRRPYKSAALLAAADGLLSDPA